MAKLDLGRVADYVVDPVGTAGREVGKKIGNAIKNKGNNSTKKSNIDKTLANSDNSGKFKMEHFYLDPKTGKTYTEAQMKAKDLSADTAKKEQNDIRKANRTKTGSTASSRHE